MADFPILSSIIPKTGIKVSFFDTDGKKVSGVTVDQANQVAKQNPDKKFYFQNGDGVEQELGIDAVNQLLPTDLLPTAPECPTAPQSCGPPLVKFFGGGGFGASANAIISPISSSIIGFDIVNPGFGFLENVSAELIDPCGKGSGSRLRVNLEEDNIDTSGEDGAGGTGGTGAGGTGGTGAGGTGGTGAGGTGGTGAGGTGGTGGTPITAGGTPVTAGGTGGTPVTAGGTPVTAGGTGGTPITAGGTPVTAGGTPVTAGGTGGTPVTAGGTGGTPVTAGGTPITAGGTGGTPVTAGGTPVTAGGTPITAGGTPVTAGGTGTLDECSIPRKNFENQIRRNLRRSKKIKNITIISPGNGYIASPDGSLGGNERVWKEPDEGYVKSKCGGFYVVQPYRPIPVKVGDTYYPPDGPPRIIEEDQIITLPLVPVSIPVVESTGTSTGSIGTSYPVILVIDEVVVLDPGFGYRPGDEIIITPSEGAELEMIVDDRGQIEKVNVIKPGSGFLDLPSIKTNSLTGFNAIFSPILRAIRLEDLEQDPENLQLITVIDIVGRIAPKVDFDIVPR
jgi:hypothetical protein